MGTLHTLRRSELGELIGEHLRSLPYHRGTGPLLWLGTFVAVPIAATSIIWLGPGFVSTDAAATGLLAGVSVLGGLLFQVLAWVSGRLGGLADQIEGRAPTPAEMALIGRLDIARSNIAYATLVSIVMVIYLGVEALLPEQYVWMTALSSFLLFHLGLTLILMLLRINRIGKTDRLIALTAHARGERQSLTST